jgi:hypothetical protein
VASIFSKFIYFLYRNALKNESKFSSLLLIKRFFKNIIPSSKFNLLKVIRRFFNITYSLDTVSENTIVRAKKFLSSLSGLYICGTITLPSLLGSRRFNCVFRIIRTAVPETSGH